MWNKWNNPLYCMTNVTKTNENFFFTPFRSLLYLSKLYVVIIFLMILYCCNYFYPNVIVYFCVTIKVSNVVFRLNYFASHLVPSIINFDMACYYLKFKGVRWLRLYVSWEHLAFVFVVQTIYLFRAYPVKVH